MAKTWGNRVGAIREWAEEHGYEITEVFKDEAITGARDPLEREAFKSLLKFCGDNNVKNHISLRPGYVRHVFISEVV